MNLPYLNGYPEGTVQQIYTLLQEQKLGPWLLKKYPQAHGLRDPSRQVPHTTSG